MDRFNGSPINQDGPFKTWTSEPIPGTEIQNQVFGGYITKGAVLMAV